MTAVANDNVRRNRGNVISRLLRSFIENRRNKRGMRDMLGLGDHLLRDIGITRFDIQQALRSSGQESCGERLARLAEENRLAQMYSPRISKVVRRHADEQMKLAA